ncbi:uncharacterized protein BDV17DRAFT_170157 [Aspergillus undulatus]|uniref:uncharacterized protein n=1 Tax=Aspergillus undulatus TaxID=1810928 RepID=UPI003CCCE3FF
MIVFPSSYRGGPIQTQRSSLAYRRRRRLRPRCQPYLSAEPAQVTIFIYVPTFISFTSLSYIYLYALSLHLTDTPSGSCLPSLCTWTIVPSPGLRARAPSVAPFYCCPGVLAAPSPETAASGPDRVVPSSLGRPLLRRGVPTPVPRRAFLLLQTDRVVPSRALRGHAGSCLLYGI